MAAEIYSYIAPTGLVESRNPTYVTAHGAANATSKYYSFSGRGVANSWSTVLSKYQIYRILITIDTTGLLPGADLTVVKFRTQVPGSVEADAGQSEVYLVEGIFGATIDLSDFGLQLPKVTSGGSIAYADIVPDSINEITLNAVGKGWINAGGLTKLCLRVLGDIDGSLPTGRNYIRMEQGWSAGGITYPCLVLISVPTVTTDAATGLTDDAATLRGTLDDDGGDSIVKCDCGFEWGETIAYGNTTPTQGRTTGQAFSQTIDGLLPGTTYHFRAFATNSRGTNYGDDRTFTTITIIVSPTATTEAANNLTQSQSNLNGILTDDGDEACDCWFEWGLTDSYGNTTPIQSDKTTGDVISQIISGLEADTLYHFRFVAENSAGTGYGADKTFVTESPALEEYSLTQAIVLLLK